MENVFTGRARLRLHQRDDGRGIDPAGEERAERDVGDHLLADRARQQLARAGRCFLRRSLEAVGRAGLGNRPGGPIFLDQRLAAAFGKSKRNSRA